ncbi:hypothetical protein BD410DRAFT_855910 [Rickenella mellea]|uniref:Uncharacterized protein n=1 Tax=Rickenella mellea TaxID=50990 RepID=A0A4Y7PJV8_9AGAM|nr:hypothetical protein BD410DRAFT_855910 [Rickenella mellea]
MLSTRKLVLESCLIGCFIASDASAQSSQASSPSSPSSVLNTANTRSPTVTHTLIARRSTPRPNPIDWQTHIRETIRHRGLDRVDHVVRWRQGYWFLC